jgi:hypothetical protein
LTRKQILYRLTAIGFEEKTRGWMEKDGLPAHGMRHPSEEARGSLYVATDFLVANGPYKWLENVAKPTKHNHAGNPVWEGSTAVSQALARIEQKYRRA